MSTRVGGLHQMRTRRLGAALGPPVGFDSASPRKLEGLHGRSQTKLATRANRRQKLLRGRPGVVKAVMVLFGWYLAGFQNTLAFVLSRASIKCV